MSLLCEQDRRRDLVRQRPGWNGLDYVEVSGDQLTLTVYFLGLLLYFTPIMSAQRASCSSGSACRSTCRPLNICSA